MKKTKIIVPFLILWICIAVILYKQGLFTTDIQKLDMIIESSSGKMELIFVLLSTLRIVIFIPQSVFVIIGGMLFGTWKGFLLSSLAILLSQSILFFTGKLFGKTLMEKDFIKKKQSLIGILSKYGYKILALGVICPVAPMDLMTLLSACLKLDYWKSIIIILLSYSPLTFLYGFLGTSTEKSIIFKIFSAAAIIIISICSYKMWRKITSENQ